MIEGAMNRRDSRAAAVAAEGRFAMVRMKRWGFGAALLIFLSFFMASPVWSQFYRYLDEKGNVRYTDDLSQVPEDQREGAQAYQESKSEPESQPSPDPAEAQKTEDAEGAEKADENPKPSADGPDSSDELDALAASLKAQRQEIDTEYAAIQKERDALNASRPTTTTKARAKIFLEQQGELEQRIQAYDKKRLQYENDVKAYNEKVRAYNEQAAGKTKP